MKKCENCKKLEKELENREGVCRVQASVIAAGTARIQELEEETEGLLNTISMQH